MQGMVASFPMPQTSKEAGRAPRFPMDLPLRYRSVGETDWHEATVENISRSGVLFRTNHVPPIDTPVEMRFSLPAGPVTPDVRCRGRVVRTVLPAPAEARPGVAATISNYRFLRSARP